MNRSDKVCKHDFVLAGIVYEVGGMVPGSGARLVEYFRYFYCRRCLEKVYDELREVFTTYDPIKFGATPK